jgi:hypothetical protein
MLDHFSVEYGLRSGQYAIVLCSGLLAIPDGRDNRYVAVRVAQKGEDGKLHVNLQDRQHDLYLAHELVVYVPLAGSSMAYRLRFTTPNDIPLFGNLTATGDSKEDLIVSLKGAGFGFEGMTLI